MTMYDTQEARHEVYDLLNKERCIAFDPATGVLTRTEAFIRIDMLLDTLIDINGITELVEASK